jgi:mono/diheme cytochrome c family protein
LRPSLTDPRVRRALRAAALVLACAAVAGCRLDMHDGPRYNPLQATAFFPDGQSARMPVANTVARGQLRDDDHLYTGRVDGEFADAFPMPVTADVMARGQERFNVFCAPCHARTGNGDGMIVQRGFRAPPPLHEPRLREAPAGYFFDVITHGFGDMQDYASQVPVADRWAITAYIRALQLSQGASVEDVPVASRGALAGAAAAGAAPQ